MGKKTSEMDVAEKVVVMSQVIGESIESLGEYSRLMLNNPIRHENVLRCISKFGQAMRELLEVEEIIDFSPVVELIEQGSAVSNTKVTLDRVKDIIDGTYELPEIVVNPKQLKENGRTTLFYVYENIADHMLRIALASEAFERELEGLRLLRVCINAYDNDDAFLVTKCLDELGDLVGSEAKLSILMGLPQEEGGNK